jgi:hypothetical protein
MKTNIKKTLTVFTLIAAISLLVGCTPAYQVPASIPVTAGTAVVPTNVCHATDDPQNPYEEINVNSVELAVHVGHAGEIIPVPVTGCPTNVVVINGGNILICHATNDKTNPYEELNISLNGLNGHAEHEGDVFPMVKGGCPTTAPVLKTGNDKITICHATNSKNNPYNLITISVNGLNGHNNHAGDIIPAPAGGCPQVSKK